VRGPPQALEAGLVPDEPRLLPELAAQRGTHAFLLRHFCDTSSASHWGCNKGVTIFPQERRERCPAAEDEALQQRV